MSRTLFRSDGGTLVLPDASSVLASRLDGGHLLVLPPRTSGSAASCSPTS